jgi:hypothetical protein
MRKYIALMIAMIALTIMTTNLNAQSGRRGGGLTTFVQDTAFDSVHVALNGLFIDGTAVTATAAELNAVPATAASAAELDYNAGVTAGTGAASKTVVLDSGEDFTWPATGILTYGVLNDATDNIDATAAEINRLADKSASVVDVTDPTISLTLLLHGDRIVTLSRAAGITVTLPAATGTGATYTIIIATGCTSNDYIIKVANGTDVFDGGLAIGADIDGAGATGYTWFAAAGDDTFTMPAAGPASGGEVGDRIVITDYKTGFFFINAHIQQGGASEATPFSAGV